MGISMRLTMPMLTFFLLCGFLVKTHVEGTSNCNTKVEHRFGTDKVKVAGFSSRKVEVNADSRIAKMVFRPIRVLRPDPSVPAPPAPNPNRHN